VRAPAVLATEYTILITDPHLNVVGDPITEWISLDVTLRWNEPGSGLFTAPGYPWIREQLAPGRRAVIIRQPDRALGYPGSILISGPIEKWLHERSDDGQNAGDGMLTVNFADDFAWIAARCAYANPNVAPEDQDLDNWTFTGNAETALRQLADKNAGPGALAARRVPQLALGDVASVGSSITVKADLMEPLADVMRRAAIAGGGLGFRTRQVGNQILFEVYDPPDKSGEVRFGFGLGNMKYLAYEVSAPTATAAIVGGQGTGADRYVLERIAADATTWGRMEKLVSRPGSGAVADLQADGDKELADGAATVRLPSNVVDTVDQQYGVHYDLGTRVSIESWPGESYSDLVTTVHLQAWPTAGEVVSATVGSQAATSEPAWIARFRALDARVGRIERTVTPAIG
jgi:hypothetical protein